jgi:hypothetical protein
MLHTMLFQNRGLTHPDEYCEKHNLEAAQYDLPEVWAAEEF